MKIKKQYRSAQIEKRELGENNTLIFPFSSEEPYKRSWGLEVLDHSGNSMRMDRLADGAPLLMDHDPTKVIGVIERAWIENGRGYVQVRFSKNKYAQEILTDILDGIRRNVSVGYSMDIDKIKQEKATDSTQTIMRVMDWLPLEVSIVGVPADQTVGIGRSDEEIEAEVETIDDKNEEKEKIKKETEKCLKTIVILK